MIHNELFGRIMLTDRQSRFVLGLAAVLLIAFVLYGAAGVRGTDQYWYVADVAKLADGGPAVTNSVFPAFVQEGLRPPYPMLHNILPMYLAVPFAKVIGAYQGWIVLNLVSLAVTAVLMLAALRRFTDGVTAKLAVSFFLLMPNTVWLSMQPLAEVAILPFVMATMYLVVRAGDRPLLWWLAMVMLGGLFLARQNCILLFPLLLLGYLLVTRKQSVSRRVGGTVLLLATGSLFVWIEARFFPSSGLGYAGILATRSHEVDVWNSFFLLQPQEFWLPGLMANGFRSLLDLFISPGISLQVFYLPFNLLLVATLLSMRRFRPSREMWRAIAFTTALIGILVVTTFFYRNAPRYLLAVTPPLLIVAAVASSGGRKMMLRWSPVLLVCGLLFLAVPVDGLMAFKTRKMSVQEREVRHALRTCFDRNVPSTDPVAVEASAKPIQLAQYVLRPRTAVFVRLKDNRPEDVLQYLKYTGSRWILCRESSPLHPFLELGPPLCNALPGSFSGYRLYPILTSNTGHN